MTRFPELTMLAHQLKAIAKREKLPEHTPGVLLALTHWLLLPLLLIYSCLVTENTLIIGWGILACAMTGAVQTVYSGRCPLIYLERELLDCPHWWRGLPFNIVAGYVQPMVVIWGTGVGLVRFIANVIA